MKKPPALLRAWCILLILLVLGSVQRQAQAGSWLQFSTLLFAATMIVGVYMGKRICGYLLCAYFLFSIIYLFSSSLEATMATPLFTMVYVATRLMTIALIAHWLYGSTFGGSAGKIERNV